MDYGNLQLRSKSFLDFTTDPAILDEILGGHSKADKEEFLRHVDQERAMTFMAFVDFCEDKQLAAAIEAEFGAEYRAIFNE
jgi:hypothetical protein